MTSNWNWTAYQVILRLHTPLHIGRGKVSYLQHTHPYVSGRVLRGALVSRVARSNQNLIGDDSDPYRRVSKTLGQFLTFTYFYPALKNGADWKVEFPWEDEAHFRRRFLSSYTSTALAYPSQSVEEGSLHEVEFISPHTLDTGSLVYLMGYIFVEETRFKLEKYDWQTALKRLQLGGERGYGWGEVRLKKIQQLKGSEELFQKIGPPALNKRWPVLRLGKNDCLLAHTKAERGPIAGQIEPVVGREWRANGQERKHIGQHLAFNDIRFAPGSIVTQKSDFSIREAGYWQVENTPAQSGKLL